MCNEMNIARWTTIYHWYYEVSIQISEPQEICLPSVTPVV